MPSTQPIWAFQPFKTFYVALFLFKLPIKLIYYILAFNLSKHMRPNPNLSAKDNVGTRVFKLLFQLLADTRTPGILVPKPSAAGERCVQVKVPPTNLFCGVLTPSDTIKPAPLEAVWLSSVAPQGEARMKSQKTMIHFPAGAFVVEMSYADIGPLLATAMSKNLDIDRFLWAQYRLAGTAGTCFPAAIQDALSVYAHVLSTNVDPQSIILSGDSAGGNVALALLRYLEESKVLPLPGGCMVFSPWLHVTDHAAIDFKASQNSDGDVLVGDFLQWGADAYRPALVTKETEPYISPLHHPFKTTVPLFLNAGGGEAFCTDVEDFASQMQQVNGSDSVMLAVTPHTTHDVIAIPGHQGKTDELFKSLRDAREIFDRT